MLTVHQGTATWQIALIAGLLAESCVPAAVYLNRTPVADMLDLRRLIALEPWSTGQIEFLEVCRRPQ